MSKYQDIEAKCPFYYGIENAQRWTSICCEGMTKNSRIKNQFKKMEARDNYKRRYCDCDYENCRLCKMLEGKYK